MADKEKKRPGSFPLRLPVSMRFRAVDLAHQEGLSLNQFISLAVAEKITRLEQSPWLKDVNPFPIPHLDEGRENSAIK
jgi:hypothetical protein